MKQPETFVNADDREALREVIRDSKLALSTLFASAHCMREGAVTPLWDKDLNDPAHVVNYAIDFIERCLKLRDNPDDEPKGMSVEVVAELQKTARDDVARYRDPDEERDETPEGYAESCFDISWGECGWAREMGCLRSEAWAVYRAAFMSALNECKAPANDGAAS